MATDLIALARQYLTPDMIGKLSGMLGESDTATGSLVAGAVPLLLGGMASGAAPGGIDALVKAMQPGGAAAPSLLDGLGGLIGTPAAAATTQAGSGLLGGLFGDKSNLLANALASFAGAKPGSASTVMALLTPILGGVMSKALGSAGQAVTAPAVLALLGQNKSGILAALPAGLRQALAGIPGLGALLGLPAAASAAPAAAAATAAATGGMMRWLPWLLGLLALLLLLWWLFGRSTVDVASCNADFRKALVGQSVNFDTGDAVVAADSKPLLNQLAEVATRCQAYKIEIGGHTDTVGDPAMNKDLSQRRADAVRMYLVGRGVPAGQLTAVGYGAERPAVATGNEVASAANRRIEFTVTE